MSLEATPSGAVLEQFDATELRAEAERIADESYAAQYAPQRTWPALAAFVALCGALWGLTWIPAVAEELSVSPRIVGALMVVQALSIAVATACARSFGGVLGRPHRVAERAETVVTAGAIAALIFASGHGASVFWLFAVLHLLHSAPDVRSSSFVRGTHAAWFVALALAFAVRGRWSEAALVLFLEALAQLLAWAQSQAAGRLVRAQAERNLLERRLKALLVGRERQRIAQDLHDGLGGHLAALAWSADALALDTVAPSDELRTLAERARNGLAELRWLLTDLKSPSMSVAELADTWRKSGARLVPEHVRYEVEHHGAAVLPPEVCYQLSLIAREATTNAIRHGAPGVVRITLASDEALTLRIDDDGRGVSAEALRTSRGGLKHLSERAALLGGNLHIDASPSGTSVRLSIPTPGAAQSAASLTSKRP